MDDRAILDGILWILRTGAPWADLPRRFPSYKTCNRRFNEWMKSGAMARILEALAMDLCRRGDFDLQECFGDRTTVGINPTRSGRKGVTSARVQHSWKWQTALVLFSPFTKWLLVSVDSPLCRRLVRQGVVPLPLPR